MSAATVKIQMNTVRLAACGARSGKDAQRDFLLHVWLLLRYTTFDGWGGAHEPVIGSKNGL
jgi:hypothetical protein